MKKGEDSVRNAGVGGMGRRELAGEGEGQALKNGSERQTRR